MPIKVQTLLSFSISHHIHITKLIKEISQLLQTQKWTEQLLRIVERPEMCYQRRSVRISSGRSHRKSQIEFTVDRSRQWKSHNRRGARRRMSLTHVHAAFGAIYLSDTGWCQSHLGDVVDLRETPVVPPGESELNNELLRQHKIMSKT